MSRDSETLLTLYQWSTADFSISLLSFISLLRHFFIATSPNFSSSSHAKFLNRKEKEKKKKKERSNSFISAFEFWYGFFYFFVIQEKKWWVREERRNGRRLWDCYCFVWWCVLRRIWAMGYLKEKQKQLYLRTLLLWTY